MKGNKQVYCEGCRVAVVNKGFVVSKALRVTFSVCSQQNLYTMVTKKRKIMTADVNTLLLDSEFNEESNVSALSNPETYLATLPLKKKRVNHSSKKLHDNGRWRTKNKDQMIARYGRTLKEAIELWSITKETVSRDSRMPR